MDTVDLGAVAVFEGGEGKGGREVERLAVGIGDDGLLEAEPVVGAGGGEGLGAGAVGEAGDPPLRFATPA